MGQVTKERAGSSTEVADDAQLKAAQDAGRTALENVDVMDIDALLDEIDDVLETNAEEFVDKFVQKGGQ